MVKCEVCGKEFKNGAGLVGHMRMAHPDSVPVPSSELLSSLNSIHELLNTVAKSLKELHDVVIHPEDLGQLIADAIHGSNPGKPEPEPEPEPNPGRPAFGSFFKRS